MDVCSLKYLRDLGQSVGEGGVNKHDDVRNVKDHLNALCSVLNLRGWGVYPEIELMPDTFPDKELFDAIREFQRRFCGFPADGLISPTGPTFKMLRTVVNSPEWQKRLNSLPIMNRKFFSFAQTSSATNVEKQPQGDAAKKAEAALPTPTTPTAPVNTPSNTYTPSSLHISDSGVDFIVKPPHEGFSDKLYNDIAGHCTIGYGHLVHHGSCNGATSENPYKNGIEEDDAKILFKQDIVKYEDIVKNKLSVKITQNQFDALCSFVYNIGNLPSSIYTKINVGDLTGACDSILKYDVYHDQQNNVHHSKGLKKRREREVELFNS